MQTATNFNEASKELSMVSKGFWEILNFSGRGDHRGELVALQSHSEIPFDIKRVYFLTRTLPDVVRGLHAHYELDQVLIAISGSCTVRVDDGQKKEEFVLNDHRIGLRIKDLIWREMYNFTPDCVLLVLASSLYDPSDYIRNYEKFLNTTRRL